MRMFHFFFFYRVSSLHHPERGDKTQPTLHVSVEVKGPEIEILKSGKMLTDRHVNSASAIIKKDFPDKYPECSVTEGIQAS